MTGSMNELLEQTGHGLDVYSCNSCAQCLLCNNLQPKRLSWQMPVAAVFARQTKRLIARRRYNMANWRLLPRSWSCLVFRGQGCRPEAEVS